MSREWARLASDCLDIATRGAAIASAGFRRRPTIREKSLHDIVTEFDLESQNAIVAALALRHPGVTILAEEDGEPPSTLPSGLAFAVDPIDGTTNFAHGHPMWCVSVGVMLDGRPIAGAIVAPAIQTAWHGHVAEQGNGEVFRRGEVFRNGAPCAPSEVSTLSDALVATGFPPVRDGAPHDNFDSFMSVKRRVRAVRRCGAAALDLAFVADGTYDAYWERRLHVWDCAAGAAMILAGGGTITNLSGDAPAYEKGHIAASNGRFHPAFLDVIGDRPRS